MSRNRDTLLGVSIFLNSISGHTGERVKMVMFEHLAADLVSEVG